MSHDKPLHGVAAYNPDLLSKDELIQLFVARQEQLDRLLAALRHDDDGPRQHHLIVARRGMGKTTLLRRLRYAIEDDETLSKTWLGLTFPEEQYNVSDLSDFWLNCVDALADTLEAAGDAEHLAHLDAEAARLQVEPDDTRREEESRALLLGAAERLGRKLVLLVDNLDLVLDRLKPQEWVLRNVLSEEPRVVLIGASSAGLESGYDYGAAFYDFFRVHTVTGLDEKDTFALLRRLASLGGNDEVLALLDNDPGRIRTARHLAGGSPRAVVLLYGILAQGIEGDVWTDLERLLDQCTPLYKHGFEQLPVVAQRVVDALAVHWDPMSAGELAAAMRAEVNPTSAALNRLTKDGLVEKVTLPDTKRLGFQLAERFFNIWYLMRTGRRARPRLAWFVEFLRLMYPSDESKRGEATPMRHAGRRVALSPAVDRLGAYEEAEAAYREGSARAAAYTRARVLVAQGDWSSAVPLARQLLGGDDLTETWNDVLVFFAECIRQGFATNARGLLADLRLAEPWRPLDLALEAAEQGSTAGLGRVAPEVRRAVEMVLAEIAPDFLATGNLVPSSTLALSRNARERLGVPPA